jgi:tRNA pseudouridine55 synthase
MADTGASGVLLLDKPPGITSTRALATAKRLLDSPKGGHTGTLDPFATGLLPLVFGQATKFARFLLDERKAYAATLRLGEETATGDTEGPVIARRPVDVRSEQIDAVLCTFRGFQDQIPPMHSAVHMGGKRLYEYAREGTEVDRPARRVEISALSVLRREGDDLTLGVTCSKGTYVRTLAQDIGRALGCGAHLVGLRRTRVGDFGVDAAVTLEELKAIGPARARERLLPLEILVSGLPRMDADKVEADAFAHGRVVSRTMEVAGDIAVFDSTGRFLGVGEAMAGGGVAPLRLMSGLDAKSPDLLEVVGVFALK